MDCLEFIVNALRWRGAKVEQETQQEPQKEPQPEAKREDTEGSMYAYIPASVAHQISLEKEHEMAEAFLREIDFTQKVESAASEGRSRIHIELPDFLDIWSIARILEPLGYKLVCIPHCADGKKVVSITWYSRG